MFKVFVLAKIRDVMEQVGQVSNVSLAVHSQVIDFSSISQAEDGVRALVNASCIDPHTQYTIVRLYRHEDLEMLDAIDSAQV